MFDGLFGNDEELEAELEALREETQSLEEQLEAEQRRRKKAVTDRQAAQQEVNQLEDRVAGLEGTVERLREDETELAYRDTMRLDRAATERVIDRLRSVAAPPDNALTAVVDEATPQAVREAFGGRSALVDRAAPCVAVTDEHGVVSAALRPPVLPEPGVTWDSGFAIEREQFLPVGRFALALVRSDRFALGIYQGDERVSFEGFQSEVKGDHSKGGFSQGRFERRRDEQIDEHLDRCTGALADVDADRLFLTGGRGAIDAIEDEVTPTATAAVDASGKPKQALEAAFEDFWTTTLYCI